MTVSFVTSDDLVQQFTAERVAEVFSVQDSSGATTGIADATALAYAIRMGSAEAERVLLGAYGSVMPFTAPYPDTLKQLVGPLVMHAGFKRRPEYRGKPQESPYFEDWKQARTDLDQLRIAMQRLSKELQPANTGVSVKQTRPATITKGGYFNADGNGEGGFNGGDF